MIIKWTSGARHQAQHYFGLGYAGCILAVYTAAEDALHWILVRGKPQYSITVKGTPQYTIIIRGKPQYEIKIGATPWE